MRAAIVRLCVRLAIEPVHVVRELADALCGDVALAGLSVGVLVQYLALRHTASSISYSRINMLTPLSTTVHLRTKYKEIHIRYTYRYKSELYPTMHLNAQLLHSLCMRRLTKKIRACMHRR